MRRHATRQPTAQGRNAQIDTPRRIQFASKSRLGASALGARRADPAAHGRVRARRASHARRTRRRTRPPTSRRPIGRSPKCQVAIWTQIVFGGACPFARGDPVRSVDGSRDASPPPLLGPRGLTKFRPRSPAGRSRSPTHVNVAYYLLYRRKKYVGSFKSWCTDRDLDRIAKLRARARNMRLGLGGKLRPPLLDRTGQQGHDVGSAVCAALILSKDNSGHVPRVFRV